MSIKDFQLKKFLGKGSYGSVYMAIRQSDGKQYAIKKVDTRRMNNKERAEAVNEIRVLASVGGPFNIRFLEAFVDADVLYIVTEFAGHGDLFGWLKTKKGRGPLKEQTVWSYFLQMCLGLQSLHDKRILHRDLKSANVFMMSDKHIKLGDFGVAKVLKTADALARTQVGTPYYVAPEVWKNKPYNHKCDVWSLGCLLYELLAYKPPFDSNSMDGLARKVMRGRYEPISAAYSQDMHALVAKLLVVEQKQRPSIEQLLADPLVRRHMDALPAVHEGDGIADLDDEPGIMATIHVPRKFGDVKQNLPPSRYETPLNTDRSHAQGKGGGHNNNNKGGRASAAPPAQAAAPPKRPGAPDVLKAPGPGPVAPSGASLPAEDFTYGVPARGGGGGAQQQRRQGAAAGGSGDKDPADDARMDAALARRQQARANQVRDPNQKLPAVIRSSQEPSGGGGSVHPSANNNQRVAARRAGGGVEQHVRLPHLPSSNHNQAHQQQHYHPAHGAKAQQGGAPYTPSAQSNQLRVVRHGQAGRTNVSVYHPGQPQPSNRSRYSQNRLPEYNPITHQRNRVDPYSAAHQHRYVPAGVHAGAGQWR
mmetsp:Transcript_2232/g.6734  ORF Transcript_2232/g.6734 Transcript_2232/m.6734 type:complete len:590 (+) Transcript_2232:71-1840(+)